MKTKITNIVLTCLCVIAISSCTKTITDPYEQEPEKLIADFKIVNTSTELDGIVDEQEKTITVVIPAGEYYTILEPKITLRTGNTLKSGSDTLITNLMDYFIHGRNILYPVTDKTGKTTNFKLTIKTFQPPLEFHELSTDPNNPVSYDRTFKDWGVNQVFELYTKNPTYPLSENMDLNLTLLKLYLVDNQGKEYEFKNENNLAIPAPYVPNTYINSSLTNIKGYLIENTFPPQINKTPPAGLYWIKVRYYSRETTLKNPIRIYYDN